MSCSICLDASVHPITIPCDHTFCYRCIFHWINQTPHHQTPTCPVCRSAIQDYTNVSGRLTRSMTAYRRGKKFITTLTEKLYRWEALTTHQDTQKTHRKRLTLLHEFFNLIQQNSWLITQTHFLFFRRVLKQKIDDLEHEGYKEATIWKYKLRQFL